MASRLETAEFICDQIVDIGNIRYKKMFGDYMIYLNDRPIFLLCDDNLFIKINEETTAFMGENILEDYPYKGSKLHYLVEFVDDRDRMKELAKLLEQITPLPKPKTKKRG